MPDSLNSQPRAGVAYASLGLPATWTLQSLRGAWPGSGVTITLNGPTGAFPITPTRFDGDGMVAVWELSDSQVDALEGCTEWRVQINDGWPLIAGSLVWLRGYSGQEVAQSLGAVLVGPPGLSAYQVAVAEGFVGTESEWLASLIGPGVASAAIDGGGDLVLTLDDSTTLDPITLPPVVGLAIDGDGDYYPAAGTTYALVADEDGDYTARELI